MKDPDLGQIDQWTTGQLNGQTVGIMNNVKWERNGARDDRKSARVREVHRELVEGMGWGQGGGNTHRGPPVRNAHHTKKLCVNNKKTSCRNAQDGVAVVGG